MSDTNIPVSNAVADYIYSEKGREQTYDDYLRDVLGIDADQDSAHAAHD